MKIAIDISPLSSGHRVRGIGSYVSMLKENLETYDKKNSYVFFTNKNVPKDADLVHFPYFDPFFPVLPFSKKIKTVVTVHDLIPIVHGNEFPIGIKGNLRWLYNKQLLKRVNTIVTDSYASKEDIVKFAGIDEKKVKVVYLAVDPAFRILNTKYLIPNTRKKFSLPENFFLYVGDATWNKNLPRLVEAFKQTSHKLVMVGKVWAPPQTPSQRTLSGGRGSAPEGEINSNPWNRDLKHTLANTKNDKQFIHLGFVETEDLVKIYNLAAALVMPSLDEGFGLPVLEAMSCGCPVITSREGSLPEVGGDAVLYADSYSEESITKAINDLDSNLKLRESLIKKGVEQAEKFTIKKSILDLVSVYEDV